MQNTNVKFIYFHSFMRNSIPLTLYYNSFQSFRCQNKVLLINKHPHDSMSTRAAAYQHTCFVRFFLSETKGYIYIYINMKRIEKQNSS